MAGEMRKSCAIRCCRARLTLESRWRDRPPDGWAAQAFEAPVEPEKARRAL
jgi:hypothetical protein